MLLTSSKNTAQPLVPQPLPSSLPPLTIEVLTENAEFNRFLKEDPTNNGYYASVRSNFWYAAKIAVFAAYSALAAAAVVLSGLFFPIYIPIATLAVLSVLPLVYNAYEFCGNKSDLANQVSLQEHGIAAKVKELKADGSLDVAAEVQKLIADAGITLSFKTKDGSAGTDPSSDKVRNEGFLLLLARHLYWKEEEEKCLTAAAEHFAKARSLEESLDAKDDPSAKEVNETRSKLNSALEDWYEMTFKASVAKTERVFTRYLLCNPYHKKELADSCSLHHCPRLYYYIGETLKHSFKYAIPTPMEALRFKEGPAIDLIRDFSSLLGHHSYNLQSVMGDNSQFKAACEKAAKSLSSDPRIDQALLYHFAEPDSLERGTHLEEKKKDLLIAKLPPEKEIADPTERWTFPSNHLPFGAQINGRTFVSWDLASADQEAKKDALVANINAMLVGENKKGFIAFQNCTKSIAEAIQLPAGYKLEQLSDGKAFIYDSAIFTKTANFTFQDKELGREYLIWSADFSQRDGTGKEAMQLFAGMKKLTKQNRQTALLLGNMNCGPSKLVQNLQEGFKKPEVALCSYPTTWKVKAGQKADSVASTQIWIHSPKGQTAEFRPLRPDQLMADAQEALELLV